MSITLDACKPAPPGKSGGAFNGETQSSTPVWGKAAEFTLPRKTSKQNHGEPYLKPTQVDEENIQRRSREHSFRNSAN
jgi:hypothetical protein